ncbi:hypothetical protein CYY_000570 [Polysphondylium violaceum]|uniref:Uncharacterized protein n=1 Tax=Polysphondylium violaceum TaxID=133409 RepID=A0A8J4Q4J0_9MYCE|nr:hypothetical protein CYY_000570 [Polysphondylium violaceum]
MNSFSSNSNSNKFTALQSCVQAALSIYSLLRTSLGPRSMSKLVMKERGYLISNDGATILKNINVQHPAAMVLVNIALSQDREIGDGTTSVVILAGEILKSMTKLIVESNNMLHQTILTSSLYEILVEINRILDTDDQVSFSYQYDDVQVLLKMAGVALGTKHYSYWTSNLTQITIDAIKYSTNSNNSNGNNNNTPTTVVDIKNFIQIVKLDGGGNTIDQTEFKKGFVFSTNIQPILLNTTSITITNNNNSNNNNSLLYNSLIIGFDLLNSKDKDKDNTLDYYQNTRSSNDKRILKFLDYLLKFNINLVFFKYKISNFLKQLLFINKISAIEGIAKKDLYKVSMICNSTITLDYDELEFYFESLLDDNSGSSNSNNSNRSQYGFIGKLENIDLLHTTIQQQQQQQQDDDGDSVINNSIEPIYYIHLINDSNGSSNKLSSIILRGPTKDIVDDLEIGIIDSLHLIKSSLESPPRIVYGGGACEMTLSVKLWKYSETLPFGSWKKSIAESLSQCFTIIPNILLMNANDEVNQNKQILQLITELSNKHRVEIENNNSDNTSPAAVCSWGIDGWTGEIKDTRSLNLIEPLVLKKSIINTAIEACITLLRIDTITSSFHPIDSINKI